MLQGRLPLDLLSRNLQHYLHSSGSTSLSSAASRILSSTGAGPGGAATAAAPAGCVHSMVLAWGNGANYCLGTGATDLTSSPTRVEALLPGGEAGGGWGSSSGSDGAGGGSSVSDGVACGLVGPVALAAAKFHSAAVGCDGRLYTWGWGRGGRCVVWGMGCTRPAGAALPVAWCEGCHAISGRGVRRSSSL